MNNSLQTFLILNLLVILIAFGVILVDPAVMWIDTIKRHARNAVLKQALIGRISWPKALPLLDWLELRK